MPSSIAQYREQYHARLLQFLDTIWDETTLNAEVDRIRNLTSTPEEAMTQTREFIALQEGRIRDEINGVTTQAEYTKGDRATVCNDSIGLPFALKNPTLILPSCRSKA